MTSLQIPIKPNRRAAARFIGQIRRAILKAYAEEKAERNLKQNDIAKALDVHRSVISRELRGAKDLTLGRVAELAWAMGREIPPIEFLKPERKAGTNVPPIIPGAQVTTVRTTSAATVTVFQPQTNKSMPAKSVQAA